MAKTNTEDKPCKPIFFDRLPEEGKEKVRNFERACKLYFKNQAIAGRVLKVTQGTINRYTAGKLLVPLEVARRFEKHTNGAITEDALFFDYKEWLYDQKIAQKNAHKNVNN